MTYRPTLDTRLAAADLQVIDAICDRFEDDRRAGRLIDLESYLHDAPPGAKAVLFRELLILELEFLRQNGEEPDARSYQQQFPELREMIDAAFESRANRVTTIRRGKSNGRDNHSTVASPTPMATDATISPRDDLTFINREQANLPGYEIHRELGRGGMGVVLKAHQLTLNRPVAIKLIKSGVFATENELLRFQNEAEAVAQLDHPHIVPIYEVGHHEGTHFFSMKLINGTSLDKRLGEFVKNPRAVAQLAAIIAKAIHHAHQRGILHRDLKPANILLDERGQPHVTDFGLAKQIKGTGELTESGAPMGTPAYMSPEQAVGAVRSLSTATDVYGLGTILYALLAGRAPFSGTTLVETLDKVRTCSPERPSLHNQHVPRDLEIICLKCLEKEPARRYASAQALADDLDRWLEGLPILARPISTTRRVVLWCRRNRALASLAALLMLALVGGLAGVTWKWREADRERTKAEAINELLTRRLLAQASLELDPLAKNLTVRELLDRAGSQLGGWLQGQPEIEAKIRETIGGAYLSLGQYERAETHLRTAIKLDTEQHGARNQNTLRAVNLLGTVLDQTQRSTEAEPLLRRSLQDCREVLDQSNPITLDAAERLGALLWHVGKSDEAEAVLRQNVDDRSRILTPEHPDTLRSTYLLSRVLRDRKKYADAEHFAYLYAHSVQCSLGSNHPGNILALTNQGDVFHDQGKLAQAEPYYRHAAVEAERIWGAKHQSTLAAVDTHTRLLEAMKPHASQP